MIASFNSDMAHLTAINQGNIQDLLWVDREADLVGIVISPMFLSY
jgi:hypothetical protein